MNMTRWLGQEGQRHSLGRRARRADCRGQAPRLEGLEDRRLLSTITWANEATDTTFDAVYGDRAPAARAVVHAAIAAWERTITSFNYHSPIPTPSGHFELTFTAVVDLTSSVDGSHPLGLTLLDSIQRDAEGKPFTATIKLDDDASENEWYFDSVFTDSTGLHVDSAEYNSLSVHRFRAGATSGPAKPDTDFYSVILHEMGHALGFVKSGDVPPAELTDSNHFDDADHPHDLMNPAIDIGERALISDADAQFLASNYGYTVASLPSANETMLSVLNHDTGELLIRNERPESGPPINNVIDVDTPFVPEATATVYVVQVNGTRSAYNTETVSSIRINSVTTANNTISIGRIGRVPFSAPISIETGSGDDQIDVGSSVHGIDGLIMTVDTFFGNDRLFVDDTLGTTTQYGLTDSLLVKSNPGDFLFSAGIEFEGVEDLNVHGRRAGGVYSILSTRAETPVTIVGDSGPDTFRISPRIGNTGGNLDAIAGSVTVRGGLGDDSVLVDDQLNPVGTSYVLTPVKLTRAVGAKAVDVGISGIETLNLLGGAGDDSLKFTTVPFQRVINYNPGAGNDTLGGMAANNVFSVTAKDAGTVTRRGFANVVNFASTENLAGNSFEDTFRFANGTRITGRIDGLGGSDTLDYSAYTTSVNVHMILGTVTGIGSGGSFRIGTIENVIGGSAADNFVGDGADNIFLGNGGDDIITARDGDDIVVGGDGNDKILDSSVPSPGVTERNLLIGGRDADVITGNSLKEELIIGGATAFDTNLDALRAILAEWKSGASLNTRVAHLRGTAPGGLNGAFVLRAAGSNPTVFDDAIADIMTAGTGVDWFFASPDDVTDRGPEDLLN